MNIFALPPAGNPERRRGWIALLALAIIAFVFYFTWLAYERWLFYMPGLLDQVNIDSAVFNTTYGELMYSRTLNGSFWAHHFSPVLLLVSVYYFFGDSYLYMFLLQNVSIALTAVPLYLIARRLLDNEAAAALIAISFLANGATQVAAATDYHMICHESLFALSALYAMMERRWRWYLLFACLTLTVREDSSTNLVWFGLFAALAMKEYRWAAVTWALGGLYALFVFKAAYPYIIHMERPPGADDLWTIDSLHNIHKLSHPDKYLYGGYYSWLGDGAVGIIKNFLFNPDYIWNTLVSSPHRVEAWSRLAVTLAFLPFISFLGLAGMALPSAEILLAEPSRIHGLYYHYALKVIPVWIVAAVFGVYNLQRVIAWGGRRLASIGLDTSGVAAKVTRGVCAAVAAGSALSLIFFWILGPYKKNILGVKVTVNDELNSIAIFFAAALLWLLLTRAGWALRAFGEKAEARAACALGLYMVAMGFYMAGTYGGLPYSDQFRDVINYDRQAARKAAAKLDRALAQIPGNATVVATPAAFTHLVHNRNANVYVGVESYYSIAENKPQFVVMEKDSFNELQNYAYGFWIYTGTERMFRNEDYGLLDGGEGVYVFKRGHDRRSNLKVYTQDNLTFPAHKAGSGTGKVVEDKDSVYGKAVEARDGVAARGHMVYGPYATLYQGRYRAVFRMKAGARTDLPVAVVDVVSEYGKKVLAVANVRGTDFPEAGQWMEIELPFEVAGHVMHGVEFRVEYLGGADVSVDYTKAVMEPEVFRAQARLFEWPVSIKTGLSEKVAP